MNEQFSFDQPLKANPDILIPTVYSGIFYPPFIDQISFQRQEGETCVPAAFRVALNSQGIQKAYGIPLQANRRMVNIFKAHGLVEVEENGAFIAQVLDITRRYPELRDHIDIRQLRWADVDGRRKSIYKDLIDGRSLLSSVKSREFYQSQKIDPESRHAISLLGVDIPSPSESLKRGPKIFVYDPNSRAPEWMDAEDVFPHFEEGNEHLSFGRMD
jgi:hypothetical protein